MRLDVVVSSSVAMVVLAALAALVTRRPSWQVDDPTRAGRVAAWTAFIAAVLFAPRIRDADLLLGGPIAVLSLAQVVVLTTGLIARLWPAPTGPVRRAALAPRRGIAALPHSPTALAAVTTTLAAFLAAGVALADEGGRSFTRTWRGVVGRPGFPDPADSFPGSYYAVPIALAVALLLLEGWWALRAVDRIPRGPESTRDDALRVVLLSRIVRSGIVGISLTGAYVAIHFGAAVNQSTQWLRIAVGDAEPRPPQPPWDWIQNLGFAAAAGGVVLVVVGLVALADKPVAALAQARSRTREPAGTPAARAS